MAVDDSAVSVSCRTVLVDSFVMVSFASYRTFGAHTTLLHQTANEQVSTTLFFEKKKPKVFHIQYQLYIYINIAEKIIITILKEATHHIRSFYRLSCR